MKSYRKLTTIHELRRSEPHLGDLILEAVTTRKVDPVDVDPLGSDLFDEEQLLLAAATIGQSRPIPAAKPA